MNINEGRQKSLKATIEELEKKADSIMEEFSKFTHGSRVLLLLWRHKESGPTNEYRRRRAREVVHDLDQMRKALIKLLLLQACSPVDMRIYMSASPRDLRKAEMEFKTQILNMDFAGEVNKKFFWENLEEKWISSLMSSNPIKDEGLFILDIDTNDDGPVLSWIAQNEITVIDKLKTKNGWHFVVKPFNRTLFPKDLGEVKDDGLLLLAY